MVLDVADTIFAVMTADLSCLKNVRLLLETIGHLGYESGKLKLVLNRSNAYTGISVKSAEGALRRPIEYQVVNEYRGAISALNTGAPFMIRKADSVLGRSVPRLRPGRRQGQRQDGGAARAARRAVATPAEPRRTAGCVRCKPRVSGAAYRAARARDAALRNPPRDHRPAGPGRGRRGPGLPGFTIVGLPDAALSEARERVRGALRNAGYHHPPRRITVNLAPAELRKAGASLDLAIAVGILLGLGAAAGGTGSGGAGRRARAGRRGAARSRPPPDGPRARRRRRAAGHRPGRGGDRGGPRSRAGDRRGGDDRGRRRGRAGPAGPARAAACRCPGRTGWRATRAGVPPPRSGTGRGAGDPATGAIRPSTWRTCAARRWRVARSRSPSPAATRCSSSGPPGAGKTLLARTIPGLLPDLDDAAALAATVVASVAGRAGPLRARAAATGPDAAPHRLLRRDGRRRPAHVARRGDARRPGRPRLRRAAGVRAGRARGAAPAPGGRQRVGGPRGPGGGVPGAVHVRRGDEPVSLRDGRRGRPVVLVPARRAGALPAADLGPAPGPDRPLGPRRPGATRGCSWTVRCPRDRRRVAARIAAARERQRARTGDAAERPHPRAPPALGLRARARSRPARAVLLAEREGLSGRGTERLMRVARTIADLEGAPWSRRGTSTRRRDSGLRPWQASLAEAG